MRNETKAELSRIFILRSLEELKSSTSRDKDELRGLIKRMEAQLHLLNDYSESLKYNDQLIGLFRKSLSNVRKVKSSARWKMGNSLVSRIEWLLGRKNMEPALDELIETNIRVIEDSNKKRPDLEPPHYLNTDYLLKPRSFKNIDSQKDGSVAIIILNYNGANHLKSLFDSFLEFNTYGNFRFVVVDHNSRDNSKQVLEKNGERLPVSVIDLEDNISFSYSNNTAADIADCEYLFFLNNDVVFADDILGRMVAELKGSKNVGVVGCSLYLPGEDGKTSGELQHSGIYFRFFKQEVNNQSGQFIGDELIETLKPYNEKIPIYESQIVPAVTGAAMMVRRSDFIALEGFDENFIWRYEDVDLCLNCTRELGKDVVVIKDMQMIHDESTTRKDIHSAHKKIFRDHNLQTLNHKHGLYIKQKYFRDLKDEKKEFTTDTQAPGFISGHVSANGRSLKIAIKNPAPSGPGAKNWGDTHFARSLSKALQRKGFETRIDYFDQWYDPGYLNDDVAIVLRGNRRYYPLPGQFNIMWNISHPELVTQEEYEGYDHIFVPSDKYCNELANDLGTDVALLQQCTDPDLFYPVDETQGLNDEFLFVGNPRGHYRKVVKFCIDNGVPLSVYGKGWDKIIPGSYIKESYIENEELRNHYSSCKVLFNDHWDDMASKGFVSNRLFDALACGCVVVTDRVEGIGEVFGDSVLVYDNEDEFRELIASIDKNYENYKKAALDFSSQIRQNHSFDQRAGVISETIKSLMEIQGVTGKKV